MKSPRLIPVVILAVAALLVLKTLGLVTTGGYILGGVTTVRAAEGDTSAEGADTLADTNITMPTEPTMQDASPTLDDIAPTLGEAALEAEHAAASDAGEHEASPTAQSEHKSDDEGAFAALQPVCPPEDAALVVPADAAADETVTAEAANHDMGDNLADFAAAMTGPDCVPLVDAVPVQVGPDGVPTPLGDPDGGTMSEKALLARLAERRTELEAFQQKLELRASLVDAAEKKIEERRTTLQALEAQISTLVDQRKQMETGQFAGIVTLYENMRPKDAANIFNALDLEVLLRVAKGMNPRKMSPILAEMEPARAQELTVRMAALADQPPEEMTAADLSALPQIVGQ